ncbi:MAG: hypothetical protein ACOH5I_21820 [Oligoflexus sp.]
MTNFLQLLSKAAMPMTAEQCQALVNEIARSDKSLEIIDVLTERYGALSRDQKDILLQALACMDLTMLRQSPLFFNRIVSQGLSDGDIDVQGRTIELLEIFAEEYGQNVASLDALKRFKSEVWKDRIDELAAHR